MDPNPNRQIYSRIRKSMNLTQRQLADALSISDKTISQMGVWKRTSRSFSHATIVCGIDITVNDLLRVIRFPQLITKRKRRGT